MTRIPARDTAVASTSHQPPGTRHRLRKFLALTWHDRFLLFEASATLFVVRLMLRLAPARVVRRALRSAGGRQDRAQAVAIVRVVWMASGQQPGEGPCLRRALTAQRLLHRRGLEATLRIGGRIDQHNFLGHAWIESGGVPLGDAEDIASQYPRFD